MFHGCIVCPPPHPGSLLSSSSSVTFYSPLSDVPEKRRGAVSALPLLPSLSLSPHSLLSLLLFGCPCECPRCNGCFTAPSSGAVPLPGLTKRLSEGGRKAFPAPCLPSLHGNVGAESGSSFAGGMGKLGGFVKGMLWGGTKGCIYRQVCAGKRAAQRHARL